MNAKHMWWTAKVVSTLAVVLSVAGCNSFLQGSWKTDPIPKDQSFYIIETQFKDDGTYQATAKKGDDFVSLAGTYDFNGLRLKLKSPGKPDREYGSLYNMLGGTLRLTSGDKSITMKKK